MADVAVDLKGGHAPAAKVCCWQLIMIISSWSVFQVGGVRQVIKPRKSESDKTDKVKPTAEDVEEFGEDKKEKQDTTVVSGAKTGEDGFSCVLQVCWHFSFRRKRGLPQGCSSGLPREASANTREVNEPEA